MVLQGPLSYLLDDQFFRQCDVTSQSNAQLIHKEQISSIGTSSRNANRGLSITVPRCAEQVRAGTGEQIRLFGTPKAVKLQTGFAEYVFDYGNVLGRGGYGVVCAGERTRVRQHQRDTSEFHADETSAPLPVAVKVIRKDGLSSTTLRRFQDEVNIHLVLTSPSCRSGSSSVASEVALDNPRRANDSDLLRPGCSRHILAFLDHLETPDSMFFILEKCRGGDLQDLVGREGPVGEPAAAAMQVQLLSAVVYLQSCRVVHRDVKPANCLLQFSGGIFKGQALKLCDFGLAHLLPIDQDEISESVGSPATVAPEVARCQNYGLSADIWSCGVVLFFLLAGRMPFWDGGGDDRKVLELVRSALYTFESDEWIFVSLEAREFVAGLMRESAGLRLSAHAALEHPWLRMAERLDPSSPKSSKVLAGCRGLPGSSMCP